MLIDFAQGDFQLCDADISIAPDDVNDVGESHTFTVHVSSTFGGVSSPVAGNTPTVTLTDANGDPITPTANTCATTGTDANGDCTVTFTSNVAGVVTGHAETTVNIGGQPDRRVDRRRRGSEPRRDEGLRRRTGSRSAPTTSTASGSRTPSR